jgi:hypothetical protein
MADRRSSQAWEEGCAGFSGRLSPVEKTNARQVFSPSRKAARKAIIRGVPLGVYLKTLGYQLYTFVRGAVGFPINLTPDNLDYLKTIRFLNDILTCVFA